MRKTILTIVMMMAMALSVVAAPAAPAQPTGKTHVAFKGDSIVINDGDEEVTVSGIPQRVRDKINDALDDTLTAGNGTAVEIDGHRGELAPEDIKEISAQWGEVTKQICYASIAGLLALVLLVLFFRFLNRRNKYRVIERAIENNYPLNELSLTDVKRSAIYVQQPVVNAVPQATAVPQTGEVPVGTPLEGMTPQQPIVLTDMANWRSLRPAVGWLGWGLGFFFFGLAIGCDNPFWPLGIALIFVGLCKWYLNFKEQQALQEAWKRAEQMRPQQEPMREGIPVPPPLDDDYRADDENETDNQPYQPY